MVCVQFGGRGPNISDALQSKMSREQQDNIAARYGSITAGSGGMVAPGSAPGSPTGRNLRHSSPGGLGGDLGSVRRTMSDIAEEVLGNR